MFWVDQSRLGQKYHFNCFLLICIHWIKFSYNFIVGKSCLENHPMSMHWVFKRHFRFFLLKDYFDAKAFVGLQWNSSHWEWRTGVKQPETAGENGWAPNMPDVSSTHLCGTISPKSRSGPDGGLALRHCEESYSACCLMTE